MSKLLDSRPAIAGGQPERERFLPIAEPGIGEPEIQEVVDTLRSGWLTTGPKTDEFERRFAAYVGNRHAVGLTSGTQALALALEVALIGRGDEVITSPMTYVASAHEIVRRGAVPVFADIDRRSFNMDPARAEQRITERTKAILLTHFAGRPCAMSAYAALAKRHGLTLISDSAHAIETLYQGRKLASWCALSAYSFHSIKNLTTGEGGMLTTDVSAWVDPLRSLRWHGVTRDAWQRRSTDAEWDVQLLGHKCNMTDIQASLGLHQLERLDQKLVRRTTLAGFYTRALQEIEGITPPPATDADDRHAWHMYNVLIDPEILGCDRRQFREALRAENVGTGHHYPALHRTRYYGELLGADDEQLPDTAYVADRTVTLPLFPAMNGDDAASVVEAVRKVAEYYG